MGYSIVGDDCSLSFTLLPTLSRVCRSRLFLVFFLRLSTASYVRDVNYAKHRLPRGPLPLMSTVTTSRPGYSSDQPGNVGLWHIFLFFFVNKNLPQSLMLPHEPHAVSTPSGLFHQAIFSLPVEGCCGGIGICHISYGYSGPRLGARGHHAPSFSCKATPHIASPSIYLLSRRH